MAYVWATLFLALALGAVGLNLLSLPGNWLVLAFAVLWAVLRPAGDLGWFTVGLVGLLALAAEAAEWLAQGWGARRYGASSRGNWGGIIGAIVGAILGAPLFLGFGALVFGLVGAFAGCLLFELLGGTGWREALRAAKGSFFGKSLGMTIKLAAGLAQFAVCAPRVWPS